MANPFPGLRPFEADEDHLFFGREKETDELLRRLRASRFVAVVGTSGSGKSSLVRSGLIPSLQSGLMSGEGSAWRIAVMRPGEDPIGHLAAALDTTATLGGDPDLGETARMLIDVTLRRSSLGLVEAVRQARLPAGDHLVVVVDQFEELFRFRRSQQIANSRDEAIAFVKLLLAATDQSVLPIYVVLTMRSDFLGDCMNFPGLPEAVNAGLYLVGRMSRDGLRAAITGPVAVAGGAIAPRLVNRVLNDLGDDHDQLPLVQHALMRTWNHWEDVRHRDGPIDIEDYDAIGTFRDALSKHAEEAYQEADALGHGGTAERVFKALTDTFTDSRGIRRPTDVAELAAISEASQADVIRIVEVFRKPGRSFLMPPVSIPLSDRSIVDLSHESLMRCWRRLITWAEEERAAAAFYCRLSQAAAWFQEGSAGVWRNPELELAQQWAAKHRPTAAWATRYSPGFEGAMTFLDRSLQERDRLTAEIERERRARLRRTQLVAGVLATLLAVSAVLGLWASREHRRAQANLALARQAVDESLAAADRERHIGADVPQVEELRRQLLSKAERFYLAFMKQAPTSHDARRDLAIAHLRLGHINRMLDRRPDAEAQYRESIGQLTALATADPVNPQNRQALAEALNWLGETLRSQAGRNLEAGTAYDSALQMLQALTTEQPGNQQYQQELARTLSNRGILRAAHPDTVAAAEADFRESLRLLDPISASDSQARQDLGRAANNLGGLLESIRTADARTFYQRAVTGHQQLVAEFPDNREYQLELATFLNNLAIFLHETGADDDAEQRSRQALDLLTQLARPVPSLAIERADGHALRATILQGSRAEGAARAFQDALDVFAEIGTMPSATRMPMFHLRFGDLLVSLAAWENGPGGVEGSRRLLSRGLAQYLGVARRMANSEVPAEMRLVLDTLAVVIPELGDPDRQAALAVQGELRGALDRLGSTRR